MTEATPIIEVNSVKKTYAGATALDGITVSVPRNVVYCFAGPNGAGKTTTVDLLAGYIRPTEGTVSVLGYDPWTDTDELYDDLGIVPEGYDAFGRLTGREHLEFVIRSRRSDDDPMALLERVGLADAADQPAKTYSSGMTQRLVIAMALVGQPSVIILDEPFVGLDPDGRELLRTIITNLLDRDATVFVSTHNLAEIEPVADRVGFVSDGRLKEDGSVAELCRSAGGCGDDNNRLSDVYSEILG